MAKISQQPRVNLELTFTVNESEARALDALVGYGVDGFLETFYGQMGKAYLQPHEQGLRTLFESIRENVPNILRRADAARKAFDT